MVLACCLVAALLVIGCRPAGPDIDRRPSVKKDLCAERLHDVCGHLLLYYRIHRKLPATLADLRASADLPMPPLVCPVSEKPYVYDPAGLSITGQRGRLVLYDPQPSHSGMRWGILVRPSADGSSITARVILVDEKEFAPAD